MRDTTSAMNGLIKLVVFTILLFGCLGASQSSTYRYPHDFERRDLSKIYLIEDSRGYSVEIFADEELIWKGVVEKSDRLPNIHFVGIPTDKQERCQIIVSGGPYNLSYDIDWQEGRALILHFLNDKVSLEQMKEPVGFQ